jgi:peptide/nickel transport system ATP-binding protein
MKMSVLLITHDLGVVAEFCEHVVVMYAGQVVESAKAAAMFARPRHPYTRGLLASIPRPRDIASSTGSVGEDRRPRTRLPTIEGMVPDLRRLGRGCRFADRCDMVIDVCRASEPELFAVDEGRLSRCFRANEV